VNRKFRKLVEDLEPTFKALVQKRSVTSASLPSDLPKRGIYLFSEAEKHLYVGRTDNLPPPYSGPLQGKQQPQQGNLRVPHGTQGNWPHAGILQHLWVAQGTGN
jgi:hypothetical protein